MLTKSLIYDFLRHESIGVDESSCWLNGYQAQWRKLSSTDMYDARVVNKPASVEEGVLRLKSTARVEGLSMESTSTSLQVGGRPV